MQQNDSLSLEKIFGDVKTLNQIAWEVRSRLRVYQVLGNSSLIRVGRAHDGGYIMLDGFHNEKIAYSFGICDDVSWDRDMASRGYDIFMYDHTIDGLPEENEYFHWKKLGIADCDEKQPQLASLQELIEKNGHQKQSHMVLKMDVEGCEWGALSMTNASVLKQFDQIVLEAHGFNDLRKAAKILPVLEHLNEHFRLIHIHPNNFGMPIYASTGILVNAFELTYVNRETYDFKDTCDVYLPISIDEPCDPYTDEIRLGFWNRGENTYIERQQSHIAWQNVQIKEQKLHIAQQADTLMHREAEIAQQSEAIAARDAEIAKQNGAIAARDAEIAKQNEAIAARDAEIAKQNEAIAARDAEIAQQNGAIAARDAEIAKQNEAIVQKDGELGNMASALEERSAELSRQRGQIWEQEAHIQQQTEELERLYRSVSWKITAPIRTLGRFLKR